MTQQIEDIFIPFDSRKVLDHGKVELLAYHYPMAVEWGPGAALAAADRAIAAVARVSYDGRVLNPDGPLIRYLMRHHHTSPFEMVETWWRCRMPIFLARQWVRHRTAAINEISARYSVLPELVYVPDKYRIDIQSNTNKQGTGTGLGEDAREQARKIFECNAEVTLDEYRTLLGLNVARELARGVLSVFHYTEWVWKMDLHNLFHFLKLRLDEHAQQEFRDYGWAMVGMVRTFAPESWEAFEEYQLYALNFSRSELVCLHRVLTDGIDQSFIEQTIPNKREREEFLKKYTMLSRRTVPL